MALTLPLSSDFEEVTSKQFQAQFGRVVDIVKGKKPVVVTQYGRRTMMILPYEEAVELTKARAVRNIAALFEERAKNPPQSLESITLDELNAMIDDERSKR